MAILHSCCWWRSVRRGAFASGIYTFFYFGSSCIIFISFLHDERLYLTGETSKPISESFLEKQVISRTTVIFNIILLTCAAFGVISSIFLIVALKSDRREYLLPWILVMFIDLLVECSHLIFLIIYDSLRFDPLIATLFTIDFFIMCLNVYCLLCVISQYEEYKAGRGCARHDLPSQTNNLQYAPPAITTNNVCQAEFACQLNNQHHHHQHHHYSHNHNHNNHHLNLHHHQSKQVNCSGGGGGGGGFGGIGTGITKGHHHECTIIPEENYIGRVDQNNDESELVVLTNFERTNSKLIKKHVKFPEEEQSKCITEETSLNGNGFKINDNNQTFPPNSSELGTEV